VCQTLFASRKNKYRWHHQIWRSCTHRHPCRFCRKIPRTRQQRKSKPPPTQSIRGNNSSFLLHKQRWPSSSSTNRRRRLYPSSKNQPRTMTETCAGQKARQKRQAHKKVFWMLTTTQRKCHARQVTRNGEDTSPCLEGFRTRHHHPCDLSRLVEPCRCQHCPKVCRAKDSQKRRRTTTTTTTTRMKLPPPPPPPPPHSQHHQQSTRRQRNPTSLSSRKLSN